LLDDECRKQRLFRLDAVPKNLFEDISHRAVVRHPQIGGDFSVIHFVPLLRHFRQFGPQARSPLCLIYSAAHVAYAIVFLGPEAIPHLVS
jgi:hypothetical protein